MTESMPASSDGNRSRATRRLFADLDAASSRELEDLIAQLVVFEFGKRGSPKRSVEVLQTATIVNRSASGGQTDQMGQSS